MLGFFCGAGGVGNLVARHHGRHTQGAGLRCPGTAQLRDNRYSRPDAIR
jgi:hypothetical protein